MAQGFVEHGEEGWAVEFYGREVEGHGSPSTTILECCRFHGRRCRQFCADTRQRVGVGEDMEEQPERCDGPAAEHGEGGSHFHLCGFAGRKPVGEVELVHLLDHGESLLVAVGLEVFPKGGDDVVASAERFAGCEGGEGAVEQVVDAGDKVSFGTSQSQ